MTTGPRGHVGAAERWGTFSVVEQLANVGSEVERSFRLKESGNRSRMDHALARALELFDLTAADERWRGARRREILRAREEFCRFCLTSDASDESVRGFRAYVLAFATAARRQKDLSAPR